MISRYYHTLRHLKPIQIRYQLYYRLRKKIRSLTGNIYPLLLEKEGYPITLKPSIPRYTSFNNYTFTFLNQSKTFPKNTINWNYSGYGKLWTYNLNYFDFLLQPEMDPKIGGELIENYILNLSYNSTGLEPYSISLRGINWIKFISKFSSSHPHIFSPSQLLTFSSSLYAQYQILLDNLEYHLMGNHLLENGFSLLFGGFYFKEEELYEKARQIIIEQLKEQILNDGGHFELSPMYHQIILDRLLDCINLVQNNHLFESQKILLQVMEGKAEKMIKWLQEITFANGQIPILNDSAPNIAPTTKQLKNYACQLDIIRVNSCNPWTLTDSGYRKYSTPNYECIIDIGPIGPDYIPGHAHADSLSFVLNMQQEPILVDTGISTYEKNEQRHIERSTSSHNTVTIDSYNSSDVWGGFRVGKRAKTKVIHSDKNKISAQHNGYAFMGIYHHREWNFLENKIRIEDHLKGSKSARGRTHFHFHHTLTPRLNGNKIYLDDTLFMEFNHADHVQIAVYNQADGFNILKEAKKVEVEFINHFKTTIHT